MNIERSTSKVFISKVLDAVVTFIGIIYFARILGASEIGSFFLFQALLRMVGVPIDFGFTDALIKRISEGEDGPRALSSAVLIESTIIIGVSPLLFLSRDIINSYVGFKVTLLLILAISVRQFSRLMEKTIRGELRVGATASFHLINKLIWVGLGVLLLSAGYGIEAIIYSLIAGFFSVGVLGIFRKQTPFGRPTIYHCKSLFKFARFSFFASVGGYAYSWIDTLLIGVFIGPAAVGVYEIAWRITQFLMLPTKAIRTTLFPQISSWYTNGRFDDIENILYISLVFSLILVVPAFVGSILYSQNILKIIFGTEYVAAWAVLVVLMGEKIIRAAHMTLGPTVFAVDRPDLGVLPISLAVISNVVLNLLLIPKFGIIGAAFGTAIASAVEGLLYYRYLRQLVPISFPIRIISWYALASVGMGLFLYGFNSLVPIDNVFTLSISILLGFLSYSTLVLTYAPVRDEFQEFIQSAIF